MQNEYGNMTIDEYLKSISVLRLKIIFRYFFAPFLFRLFSSINTKKKLQSWRKGNLIHIIFSSAKKVMILFSLSFRRPREDIPN